MELSKFEKKILYTFKNKDLLKEALTHRSYLNENPSWPLPHNERMEFLGDAVLELVVTEYLYKNYPKEREGKLTSFRAALVNYVMLSEVAKEIDLHSYIFLSKGEMKDMGKAREVILANAIEALIGAIYLDGGYNETQKIISRVVIVHLNRVIQEGLYQDPKSLFQEIAQEKNKITPTYKVLSESGPDHSKKFLVGLYLGDKKIAEGAGLSKQEAETAAAEAGLEEIEKN